MLKQPIKAEFKNFSQGLITEASQLNAPENSFQDGVNFEIEKNGTLNRRLGMDLEDASIPINTAYLYSDIETASKQFYKWTTVSGNQMYDFAVVQLKNTLYFFNIKQNEPLFNSFIGYIYLDEFSLNTEFSLAAVEGSLVVACGNKKIAVVKCNLETFTFSATYLSIKTRDVWGVPATSDTAYDTDPSYRGGLDQGHLYNLHNQGWGIPRKNASGIVSGPLGVYHALYSVYPSNSEVVWTGLQFQAGSDPSERIFPKLYEESLGINNKAAKGYFIIDALDRGFSRNEAIIANKAKYPSITNPILTFDEDSTTSGATIVAQFAGRVFYAGFNGEVKGGNNRSPQLNNYIFFSQLVRNEQDYNKCYQDGDPTSRESNDIVDTDGGFIPISSAKQIIGLRAIGDHLIVIATNGVWAISGGNDYGFSVTNYKVSSVTTYGGISHSSIVDDGSRLFYWGLDGIFVIEVNERGGVTSQSVSESTIQQLYRSINNTSKRNCSGVYDTIAKKIRWIYQTGDLFDPTSYTNELVFDMNLKAFYLNKLGNDADNYLRVIGAIPSSAFRIMAFNSEVDSIADSVVSGSDVVLVSSDREISADQSLRYLVLKNVAGGIFFCFAYYKNLQFADWDSSDAAGYILTSDYTLGDSSVKKQVTYLTTHMDRTDTGVSSSGTLENTSGCILKTQWDWAESPTYGRWSNPQQIYRIKNLYLVTPTDEYHPGTQLVTTKNKIRGHGRAFSLMFSTEPVKDCKLVGWSMSLSANGLV